MNDLGKTWDKGPSNRTVLYCSSMIYLKTVFLSFNFADSAKRPRPIIQQKTVLWTDKSNLFPLQSSSLSVVLLPVGVPVAVILRPLRVVGVGEGVVGPGGDGVGGGGVAGGGRVSGGVGCCCSGGCGGRGGGGGGGRGVGGCSGGGVGGGVLVLRGRAVDHVADGAGGVRGGRRRRGRGRGRGSRGGDGGVGGGVVGGGVGGRRRPVLGRRRPVVLRRRPGVILGRLVVARRRRRLGLGGGEGGHEDGGEQGLHLHLFAFVLIAGKPISYVLLFLRGYCHRQGTAPFLLPLPPPLAAKGGGKWDIPVREERVPPKSSRNMNKGHSSPSFP